MAVGAMVVLHVWGALGEAQPISETVEILFYSAIFVAGLLFFPGEHRDERVR